MRNGHDEPESPVTFTGIRRSEPGRLPAHYLKQFVDSILDDWISAQHEEKPEEASSQSFRQH